MIALSDGQFLIEGYDTSFRFDRNKYASIFSKCMCYRDRVIGFLQNDNIYTKNALSKASTKTYYLQGFQETWLWTVYEFFAKKCQKVFDDPAPQKKKYICGNHKSSVSKRLPKQ